MGKAAHLEEAVLSVKSRADGETVFRVNFEWDESQGIPGAVLVRNLQHAEFFLKRVTLEGVPGKGTVVFVANSWVYPHHLYAQDRIFFANDVSTTPVLLLTPASSSCCCVTDAQCIVQTKLRFCCLETKKASVIKFQMVIRRALAIELSITDTRYADTGTGTAIR